MAALPCKKKNAENQLDMSWRLYFNLCLAIYVGLQMKCRQLHSGAKYSVNPRGKGVKS